MNVSKKQFLVIGITILMLILFSNIFGFSTSNYKPKYGITTANVNFRKTANLNKSNIIQVVKKSTKVKIVGEISDFYITELNTSQVGLLSKSYVKVLNSAQTIGKTYTNFAKYNATLTGQNVNLRGGPSTSFKSYTKLKKNTKVEVIGEISNFNMIVTSDNTVGMVRNDYLKKVTNNTNTNTTTNNSANSNVGSLTTSAEITSIFNMINELRKKENLSAYTLDKSLNNVAGIKAKDMANSYFSHTSPKYGDPFKMMQGFGINYKSAGENIAGNPNLKNAISSFVASSTHKKNILSNKFTNIGIGIAKDNTYGYILVLMFIQN